MRKRAIHNALNRRIIKYAVSLAVGLIIFTQIIPWGWELYKEKSMYATSQFNSELWNKTSVGKRTGGVVHDWIHYRCGMYEDLVNNHLKIGMKLKEVTDILGETNFRTYCGNKKVKCLKYELGVCSDWNDWHNRNFLDVCFDKNEESIGFGKSFYNKDESMDHRTYYAYLACGGRENTIGCLDIKCWSPSKREGDRIVQDEIDFKQW
jgi:hypothetical protein